MAPPRPSKESMEMLHDFGAISPVQHMRQAIKDVAIQPAPTSLQVTFRTLFKAVTGVFIFRASSDDFAADSGQPGSIVAYQVDETPVHRHSLRLHEQTVSGEPLEQDTLYWVRIVCPDKNSVNIEYVRKIRTWKRTAAVQWNDIKIVNDSDGGGRGELMFAWQVFDNGNGKPITNMQYTEQRSLNTGDHFANPFGLSRIDLAPDVLGFYLWGSDDDALGVYFVGEGYPQAPWNRRHRECTNGGFMGPDQSTIYDVFALPDEEGSYTWTLPYDTLEGGRLRFRAYIKLDVEVIATSQPIYWWRGPPSPYAIAVVDLADFAGGIDLGATPSEKGSQDRAMRLTHAPDGTLIFVTSEARNPKAPSEPSSFSRVKIVRTRGGKEPPVLVALEKIAKLHCGKMHLGKTPRIDWESHAIPVRGEPTIAARSDGCWEIIALSGKGEPISIRPNGKSSVIGPAIDLDPAVLIATEAARGWNVCVAGSDGKKFVLLGDGKAATWEQLPEELGDILHMKARDNGEVVVLGLGPDRSVRLWKSNHGKIETYDRLEHFDLSPEKATSATSPAGRRDAARPRDMGGSEFAPPA